jgi:hypothetical protein
MIARDVNPMDIFALHGVVDANKLSELVVSIADNGWDGRPVILIDFGMPLYHAVTGSHRIAACSALGENVSAIIVDLRCLDGDHDGDILICNLIFGSDDDKLDALIEINRNDIFDIDYAVKAMSDEIDSNWEV